MFKSISVQNFTLTVHLLWHIKSPLEKGNHEANICGLDSHGNKQYGCTTATNQWYDDPVYVGYYAGRVSQWTGLANCAMSGYSGNLTAWQNMSLVDGSNPNATVTYNYPNTKIHAWLCRTSDPCNDGTCPNNSAAQGNDFYSNFTTTGNPGFQLTGIKACLQEEGVSGGTDPDTGKKGMIAVQDDMEANCQ
jgi:hypothetical protein